MIRFLGFAFSLLVIALLGLIWSLFSAQPAVLPQHKTHANSQEVIFRETQIERQITRLFSGASIPVAVNVESQSKGRMDITITLTTSLPNPYLNMKLQSVVENETLRLTQAKIGQIPLSGNLLDWLLNWVPTPSLKILAPTPHAVTSITKQPAAGQLIPLNALLASKPRLAVYYRSVSQWSHQPRTSNSIISLLRPLFRLAYRRSTADTAPDENQALLQILAAYVNHKDPGHMFNLDRIYPIQFTSLKLQGRHDLAQHFAASAAIAASTNEEFAASMGVYKELSDIKKGSGFSFSDLVADMAGARFGNMATTKDTKARLLQKYMAMVNDENFFMPYVRDMPDHLGKLQFEKRFGGISGAGYQRMHSLITKRIDQCPLYRW